MKITKIDLRTLRNDEHFQFHTEFRDLVMTTGLDALNIQTQFDVYRSLFEQEDEALKKIMKSAITEDIQEADRVRDNTFAGIVAANKAALLHFRSEVVTAARRLQIVFNTYGNVARKPLNEQTSAVYNLLQELQDSYQNDVNTIGVFMADWVQELKQNNEAFAILVKDRYDESAQRTDLILKEVRTQVDAAYRTITERIDAYMILEDSTPYEKIIRRWNTVVEKYKNIMAQRQGRNTSKSPKGDL